MGRGRGRGRQTALLTTSQRRETGSFTPGKDSSHSGAELRVSPSHHRPGQARGEPGEFPKAHERQGREGKKSSLLGLMPGELLKRGLRVGGGVSLPRSRNGREEGPPRRHLHASETLRPGTGTLTAALERRRYLGPGLGQAPLLSPRRCLRPPLPPFSGSGSGSPSPTRPSILEVTDRAERPMRGILGGFAGGALGGRGRGGSARAGDAGTCSSWCWEEPVAARVSGVGWSRLWARRSPAGNFLRPGLQTASSRVPDAPRRSGWRSVGGGLKAVAELGEEKHGVNGAACTDPELSLTRRSPPALSGPVSSGSSIIGDIL